MQPGALLWVTGLSLRATFTLSFRLCSAIEGVEHEAVVMWCSETLSYQPEAPAVDCDGC